MWLHSFLAALLLLTAGMSARPTHQSSLTFPPPTRGFGTQQLQQTTIELGAGHLSEPYGSSWCPATVRLNQHLPTWSHGYLAQLAEENFPLDVNVYDPQCKQVSATHITIPGLTGIGLLAAVPAMDGNAIVSGIANTNPGHTYFLAKTSTSGGVASVLRTEAFMARRMCEASDHTVWTLGRDQEKEYAHDDSYPLVQQYSFEKGLLHSYLSKAAAGLSNTQMVGLSSKSGGLLVCGRERISLYFNETNEYIEIDPSTDSLKRWKMNAKPFAQGMVSQLAVTEKGRVYASLFEDRQTETERRFWRGLFELRLEPNFGSGRWSLVNGALDSYDPEDPPKDAFFKLWGADGEDLVIRRLYDADMSWVRVIP